MDLNILGKIMQGGSEKVREAGGVLAGGHSIADSDVKYGLSVTGIIHPDRVFANSDCKEGDALILTKPLGVGIVCTAARMKAAPQAAYDLAVQSMTTLNKYASEILKKYRLHGCTDVTGFSFLGHLCEMVTDQPQPASIRIAFRLFRRRLHWQRNSISQQRLRETATMCRIRLILEAVAFPCRKSCLIPRPPADCLHPLMLQMPKQHLRNWKNWGFPAGSWEGSKRGRKRP